MIKFAELIRKKRREAGLTQEQLSEKVGVSVSYIGKIEIGIQEPGPKVIIKLMKVLGIKVNEIPVGLGVELLSELNMIGEKLGDYDKKFKSFHPRVKAFLLSIAPIAEEYL